MSGIFDDVDEAPQPQTRNVQACLDWYAANRPDALPTIEKILAGDRHQLGSATAMLGLLLQGFEAGREFQSANPDVPLGGGVHYLPNEEGDPDE